MAVGERVVALDLGIKWDPNAPAAALIMDDDLRACLALAPHHDDPDERIVVMLWEGCRAAVMQPPNDEAISGHPLYDRGLSDVVWTGEVLESEWRAGFERQNRVHPHHDAGSWERLRHFIVCLKECVVEVLCDRIVTTRCASSSTAVAAATILRTRG